MKRMRFIFVIALACCHFTGLSAQGLIDSIGSRLQRQLQVFPQEKVCLTIDRTVLMPDDTIRLKAYVTDAATLQPLLDNQFVYVELLNAQNRSLQRKRLICSNNLYTGYIPLPPDQQPGVYLGTKAHIFGDTTSGVVNVTTRNGMNRSTSNIFNNRVLRLAGYQRPIEYYFPRYAHGEQPSQLQPDVRRTLYWNPYLRMVKDAPIGLSFYSADLPTTYTIRAEGITTHGRIVSGLLQVQVAE